MHSNPSTPTTNSDGNMAPSYSQDLMFSPAGQEREIYIPQNFCAHLRRHWRDRPRKAKKSQRPPDAGQAGAGTTGGGTAL